MMHPTSVRTAFLTLCACGSLLLPLSAAPPKSSALPEVHPAARKDFSAILMWHDVVQDKKLVWFDTTVKELTEQFESIRRRKLTPITLDKLADHLERGTPVPKGSVVLTFDDNNLGLYQYAFPLLKKYRWPAVLFVHTFYVGKPTGKEHCTWEQLKEMEASGLVKAYPHTVTHPADLRAIPEKQLQKELTVGMASMEKHLGGKRPYFAYSEGHYDERVARAVLKAGYRLGITEDWGAAERSRNLMMVRRYSMHKRAKQAVEDVARAMGGR